MSRDSQNDVAGKWGAALVTALEFAIEHLQVVIFDDGLEELAGSLGTEAALRESVLRYEQGLTDLFGFVRACGVMPDAVAWSTLKAEQRRAALDSGAEITLRTALESGMYAAEAIEPGDYGSYRAWAAALTGLLAERARVAAGFPSAGSEEERLLWAYETLADLEAHEAFHGAVVDATGALGDDERRAAAALQTRLLALPRFDLVLNAALLWLARHGEHGTQHT